MRYLLLSVVVFGLIGCGKKEEKPADNVVTQYVDELKTDKSQAQDVANQQDERIKKQDEELEKLGN